MGVGKGVRCGWAAIRTTKGQESSITARKADYMMALLFPSSWGTSECSTSKISLTDGPAAPPEPQSQQPSHSARAGRQIMRSGVQGQSHSAKREISFFPTKSLWAEGRVSIFRERGVTCHSLKQFTSFSGCGRSFRDRGHLCQSRNCQGFQARSLNGAEKRPGSLLRLQSEGLRWWWPR